ncbi:MAG: rod-binding protein [Spirochaetales bacterium]|nr:rod-binding protein [Spirochaetales bacterium]
MDPIDTLRTQRAPLSTSVESLRRLSEAQRAGDASGATRAADSAPATNEFERYFPGLSTDQATGTPPSNERVHGHPADIEREISVDPTRRRLYEASLDLQAIFIKQMLQSMRSNLKPEDGLLHGGSRQELFEDMLYDEYAKQMSRSTGFDLADSIYRQMSPALGPVRAAQGAAAYDADLPESTRLRPGITHSEEELDTRSVRESGNRISSEDLFRLD